MKKVGKDGTITVKVFTFFDIEILILCVINVYNTIQYKTCNVPYVTKMLFVGSGMTRD